MFQLLETVELLQTELGEAKAEIFALKKENQIMNENISVLHEGQQKLQISE